MLCPVLGTDLGKSEEKTIIRYIIKNHTPKIGASSVKVQVDGGRFGASTNIDRTKIEGIILEVLSWNFADFSIILRIFDGETVEFIDENRSFASVLLMRVLRWHLRRCDAVFTECVEVRSSSTALILGIVRQGKTFESMMSRMMSCHVYCQKWCCSRIAMRLRNL
jgi:hypothetical protein